MASPKSSKTVTYVMAVIIVVLLVATVYEGLAVQNLSKTSTASSSTTSGVAVGVTTYTIGGLFPTTGDDASCGVAALNSAQAAVNDINTQMTTLGAPYHFNFVNIDVQSTAAGELTAITTLHGTDGVNAALTFGSTETSGAIAYANSAHVLMLATGATGIGLTTPGGYLFRNIQSDSTFVKVAAATMYQLGFRKIVVMYENDAYGQGFGTQLPAIWANYTGTSSKTLGYALNQNDYGAEVTQVSQLAQQLGVDNTTAWFWIGESTDSINIFQHAAQDPVLSHLQLFTKNAPVSTSADYPPNAPVAVAQYLENGSHVMGFTQAVTEVNNPFTNLYWNNQPQPPCYANTYSWDGAWLLAKDLMLVGNNGPALKNALPTVASDFVGVSGPVQFDSSGDNIFGNYNSFNVHQFQNGTWYTQTNGLYDASAGKWSPIQNGATTIV
ncbi:MAG: ABC transporter substrate-binding protein [Thaumarchaeota archaeon]|nr:ABC transporter substrate-binding protein [Nitrososphaerota archaeon]